MFFTTDDVNSIPLIPVSKLSFENELINHSEFVQQWLMQNKFKAEPHTFCMIPGTHGEIDQVFFGIHDTDAEQEETSAIWRVSSLPGKLPPNVYHLESDWDENTRKMAAIGWGLGAYKFGFFKKEFTSENSVPATLKVSPEQIEILDAYVDSFTLVRDLVNAPASHMMPEDLSEVTQELAQQFSASFSEIVDEELLVQNFPAIHAVGRASSHPPRLLKLEWGDTSHPLVCLVGKGVCFDTGGLDLKPSKFMRWMKKDMGGAAHVLGLANLIMSLKLPVRIQVLIPAVDNAVSGDAFRPGDVLETRSGLSVEIDNTDAEGRLVLCDALTLACEQSPDLILDFATLTGAARVAVGTEIPALFSNKTTLSMQIQSAAKGMGEVVWPLPMHKPYRYQLDSPIADMQNSSPEGYGGAIIAALYLNEFVAREIDWAHLDMMAWNTRDRAGRPKGGEAMGLLTVFNYLQKRYKI